MRMFSTFTTATLSLLFALPAWAHIQLQSPTARYKQDNNGLKDGPCGSGTASNVVTPLVPGQNLTVTWKESVGHAGHFRIALSAKASDFTTPSNLDVPTTLPDWDLADGIQDKTGTQTYNQVVKIPDEECPACILQLIQVMSGGTDGTNTGTFNGNYFACADVSILASNATADAGATGGSDARADALRVDGRPSDASGAAGGSPGAGGTGGQGAGGSGSGGHDMGGAVGSGGGGASDGSASGGNGAGGAGSGGARAALKPLGVGHPVPRAAERPARAEGSRVQAVPMGKAEAKVPTMPRPRGVVVDWRPRASRRWVRWGCGLRWASVWH
jgi:hypothetical protein